MMSHLVLAVFLGLAQSGFCCDEACECSSSLYPKCCPELIAQIEARYEYCGVPDVSLCYLEEASPFFVAVSTTGFTSGLGLSTTPTAITNSYTCSQTFFYFYFADCSSLEASYDFVLDERYPILSRADGSVVGYIIQRDGDCTLSYICSPEGGEGVDQGFIKCSESCCDTSGSVTTLSATAQEFGLCLDQLYEGCTC